VIIRNVSGEERVGLLPGGPKKLNIWDVTTVAKHNLRESHHSVTGDGLVPCSLKAGAESVPCFFRLA
jgi:hypothetical protein